eukprot:562659-Pyramimonas_sp.AAC.1
MEEGPGGPPRAPRHWPRMRGREQMREGAGRRARRLSRRGGRGLGSLGPSRRRKLSRQSNLTAM